MASVASATVGIPASLARVRCDSFVEPRDSGPTRTDRRLETSSYRQNRPWRHHRGLGGSGRLRRRSPKFLGNALDAADRDPRGRRSRRRDRGGELDPGESVHLAGGGGLAGPFGRLAPGGRRHAPDTSSLRAPAEAVSGRPGAGPGGTVPRLAGVLRRFLLR